MKKRLISIGFPIFIFLLAIASCQQPSTDAGFEENMAEIKLEMQDAAQKISVIKEEGDMAVFISETDALLNNLDDQIDEYHNEMDRALQKIEKETRDRIIRIKQKMVEIDFRLSLLDDDETVRRRIQPVIYPYIPQMPVDTLDLEQNEPLTVEYGAEVKKSIINNLDELRSEVEEFISSLEY